jgi:putative membrane protein
MSDDRQIAEQRVVEPPPPAPPPWPKREERLHPLTPFIRGWILLVAIAIFFGREYLPGGDAGGPWLPTGPRIIFLFIGLAVVLAAAAGFVSWYSTRYVIDEEELRIESGVLFKTSKKVPFERLQSVDLVQPFAARLFDMAELRMEVGAGDSVIKLHYLRRSDADRLRDYLLARAHGMQASLHDATRPTAGRLTDLSPTDQRLVVVTPQRLIGSFLLSTEWVISIVALIGLFTMASTYNVLPYALPGLIPMAIAAITLIGNRVIGMFNFTLAESPRGLRAARGLTSLTSQSIPIDRIQGIRVAQPLLWRPFHWYRVDVNILGYSTGEDEDSESRASSVLLPVADKEQTRLILSRVLAGVNLEAVELHPSPPAARWVRWFDFWTLRYGYDDRVLIAEHGWLTHVRDIVPHAKTQSVRLQQGPLQRRLGLADVHFDITRGPVTATAHQVRSDVARQVALSQLDRARAAREAIREERPIADVLADARDHSDKQVLARFGIGRKRLLGSGGESEVFALDDERVLRLYRSTHEAPERTSEQLKTLYDLWATTPADTGPVALELPRILELGDHAGRRYSIDRRMSGRIMSAWLPRISVDQRRHILLDYLDAAAALQRLSTPTTSFARLIGEDAAEFGSLAELLTAQLARAVHRSRTRLEQDVSDVVAIWDYLQAALVARDCEPRLVHGDFCPPNVYLSRDSQGVPVVSGVGDFSPHTLCADPMLDITGAVAFLELESYPEAGDDAAWLTSVATERFGPETAELIKMYRIFYGFYFSNAYEFDPQLYAWCLRQLRMFPPSRDEEPLSVQR